MVAVSWVSRSSFGVTPRSTHILRERDELQDGAAVFFRYWTDTGIGDSQLGGFTLSTGMYLCTRRDTTGTGRVGSGA